MHSNVTSGPARPRRAPRRAGGMHAPLLRPMLPAVLLAAAASLYGWAVFIATFGHPGAIGFDYGAPGTDWMALYGAIRLAVSGHFALTADSTAYTAYLNTSFAAWLPHPLFYRPWVYPPSFLVFLLPIAPLGLMGAYAAFQLATAALLAAALLTAPEQPASARWVALAALVCPAASVNVVEGQTAFLIAALLVLGFRLLPRRPWLGGLLLGLASVKPHFAVLVPVALLALRCWPALAAAAASALALMTATATALGPQAWLRWAIHTLHAGDAGSEWDRFGRIWDSSVFTCATLLHAPPALATLLQAAAGLAAIACVYASCRRPLLRDRRLAILLAATVLAAPHLNPYDMVLLAIAGALWFASLPAPTFKQAMLVLMLWVVPLLCPPLVLPAGRLQPLLVACFLAAALRRPATLAATPAAAPQPA